MKTVGEFKKAGLQFVNGDKGDGFCVKEHKYFGMIGVFDNKRATHFSWRENTGVKPEFKGVIEFTFNGEGCEMQEVRLAENVNWEIVKKWRPSLNQPSVSEPDTKQSAEEKRMDIIGQNGNDGLHYDNTAQQVEALALNDKPIFTQAMAGGGDFKSGQKVYIAQINTLSGVAEKRYFVEQFWCDSGHQREYLSLGILFDNKEQAEHKCKSLLGIDTRTDREKAIDAAMTDIGAERGDLASVVGVVERMIAAGYSKC